MFQKLHVDGFKWKENESKFDEEFTKNYYEDSNKGYESTKDLHNCHSNLLFLSEKMKIKKYNKLVCNKLVCNFIIKKNMSFI